MTKSSFISFPPKLFTGMVDIDILDPIGSFNVHVDSIFFVLRWKLSYLLDSLNDHQDVLGRKVL
jgi:hypothetical protein